MNLLKDMYVIDRKLFIHSNTGEFTINEICTLLWYVLVCYSKNSIANIMDSLNIYSMFDLDMMKNAHGYLSSLYQRIVLFLRDIH